MLIASELINSKQFLHWNERIHR